MEIIFFDNEKYKNKDIKDYFIKQNNGYFFCRKNTVRIPEGFVKTSFNSKNTMGYVLKIDNKYAGYILFRANKKSGIYIKLICAIDKRTLPERKHIKVGKILMNKVEEYAIKNNYEKLSLMPVGSAGTFYQKIGWKYNSTGKMFKKLSKKSYKTPTKTPTKTPPKTPSKKCIKKTLREIKKSKEYKNLPKNIGKSKLNKRQLCNILD